MNSLKWRSTTYENFATNEKTTGRRGKKTLSIKSKRFAVVSQPIHVNEWALHRNGAQQKCWYWIARTDDRFIDTRSFNSSEWKLNGLHSEHFIRFSCVFFWCIVIVDLIVFVGSIIMSALVEKSNQWLNKKKSTIFFISPSFFSLFNSATWCNCGGVKLCIFSQAQGRIIYSIGFVAFMEMQFAFCT